MKGDKGETKMGETIKFEWHSLNELQPYEHNARKHEHEDVEAIKRSIEEFGFNDPIGIWSDDNLIVEGHGRLIAAKELGISEVPCIRLDHLTDEQRRAYALAHNKTAELSAWDFNTLDLELAGIQEIDMSMFGFEDVEIDPESTINEAKYTEDISVTVKCKDDDEAEELFERLTEEGYECHISTL